MIHNQHESKTKNKGEKTDVTSDDELNHNGSLKEDENNTNRGENNNNLNLVSMTSPGQVLLFNKVQKDKDKKYQKYRLEKLSKIKNSIIRLK